MAGILAAIDFSDVTSDVLAWATRLGKALACPVWLIHVAAPDPDFVGYEAGPQSTRDARAEELREEHRELQARADALREAGLEATALMVEGPTVEKIVEEAQRLEVELVVLGSHGKGALHRALLGSVSEGVVRAAARPVLIAPSARK